MAEASKRALSIRRKQILMLASVAAAILALSIGASFLVEPGPKQGPVEQPKTKSLTIGGNSTDKESWRIQSAAEFANFKNRLESLEREYKARTPEALAQPGRAAAAAPTRPVAPPVRSTPPETPFDQIGAQPLAPPVRTTTPSGLPPQPARTERSRIKSVTADETAAQDAPPKTLKTELIDSARRFGEEETSRRGDTGAAAPAATAGAKPSNGGIYLPSGTFVRVVMLNGLDAPTGGQAQQNPNPVLARSLGYAQLPNRKRVDIGDCMFTANGYGDLSSERAYIRTDRLSCVNKDGSVIDVPVKGYVSGEDGKTGMRGRLVTKTGQVLANAITVGLLSGFGEGLRQNATSTTTSGLTGSQTQNVTNPWEYGIGSGVGKAMDRVAQYYLKLADKLFPVIEVDGGRVVDIVINQGITIERN